MTTNEEQTQQPKKLGSSANIIIGKKVLNSNDTKNSQSKKYENNSTGLNAVKPSTLRTGSDIQNAMADNVQRGSEITAPQHIIKQSEDILKGYQILSTVQSENNITDMPDIISAPPFLSNKSVSKNPAVKSESVEKTDIANNILNNSNADKVDMFSVYDETNDFSEAARSNSVIIELPQYNNSQSMPVKALPFPSVNKNGSNVLNLLKAANPFMSDIKGKLQGELGKQGDIETAAVSEVIKAGEYGVKSVKKAQDISYSIINKVMGKPYAPKPKQKFKIARSGVRRANNGISKVGNMMSASGDMGAEAIGLSIKSINYTAARIKTAPIAFKAAVGGVKTIVTLPIKTAAKAYKTGKKAVNEVKRAQKEGAKKTAKRYGEKVLEEIEKAGKSVVSAIVNSVKKAGAKVILPVILLSFFAVAMFNIITAPVSGAAAIFGNIFSIFDNSTGTYTDYEIRGYVRDAVIPKRIDYANKITNIRNTNLAPYGSYHYIRLFTENNDAPIDIMSMSANIMDYIYTEDELAYIIEPLFNTIVFTKYGLEPTKAQADGIIDEIWDMLMDVKTKELPLEYCYGATVPHYDCGAYPADILTCRNYTYGYHYYYTCDICCWVQDCSEWKYDDVTGTYYMAYWTADECNGYYHCNGHKILGVYQNTAADGIYELLIKYFLKPIDYLANLTTRTDAQEDELQALIDNYDLCLAYMEDVQEHYGINAGIPDISGVVFLPGSRPGSADMVKTAKTQVGKKANSIYWSWQGITEREEWSANFVSWVAYSNGYIPGGSFPNFSDCGAGVTWFKNNSLWKKAKDYTEPVAGDIIFLDWSGGGTADRAGIVIGSDGEFVYAVEGNNGDVCRIRCYSLTSSLILGYGLPDY